MSKYENMSKNKYNYKNNKAVINNIEDNDDNLSDESEFNENNINNKDAYSDSNSNSDFNDDDVAEIESVNENDESENEESEEDDLKNELEEVPFGDIIKAQAKLSRIESKEKFKEKRNKIHNLNSQKHKLEEINRIQSLKDKSAPKEKSALKRYSTLYRFNQKNTSQDISRKSRDPRFDDLSTGKTTLKCALKKYDFLETMSKEYINKVKKVKSSKELTLNEQEIEKLAKNKSEVNNYLAKLKEHKLKTELKDKLVETNKERVEKGKDKVYIKKQDFKKLVNQEYKTIKENEDSKNRFLKKKKRKF